MSRLIPTKQVSNIARVSLCIFFVAFCAASSAWGADKKKSKAEPQEERAPAPADGGAPAADWGGWTIVLAAYSGEDAADRAAKALERVRASCGLPEARLQARDRGVVVVYGDFASPAEEGAKSALERVRMTEVNGERLFAGAFLAPPQSVKDGGGQQRWALSTAREEFGKSVRYTLQIGVYESAKREEAREAAEKAAAELRRAGEPAYYFHGPTRSMVTVGAFTEKEARGFLDRAAGQTTGEGAPDLWELHRRHPKNLLNGNLSLVEKPAGGARDQKKERRETDRAQPSFLVEIP